MKINNRKYQQQGFTLIELAIVLFVVGLLLGGFLAPLANKIEFENRVKTQLELESIRDAIIGYVIRNGYFPCPDIRIDPDTDPTDAYGDGKENRNGNVCESLPGNGIAYTLPHVDLGLNGNDAWDNPYIYQVDPDFADLTDGTSCTPISVGVSFSLCSNGNIVVKDSASATSNIAEDIPAIVVSQGSNASETPSADEAENSDGNAVFVQRDYSANDTNAFDDIVIWISPHILRNRMVEAGILP